MSKLQIPSLNLLRLPHFVSFGFFDNGDCRVEMVPIILDAHKLGIVELDRRTKDLDLR